MAEPLTDEKIERALANPGDVLTLMTTINALRQQLAEAEENKASLLDVLYSIRHTCLRKGAVGESLDSSLACTSAAAQADAALRGTHDSPSKKAFKRLYRHIEEALDERDTLRQRLIESKTQVGKLTRELEDKR